MAVAHTHILHYGRLQHETVVEFWGFCVDPPRVFLAFEFCEQGSLFDVLHKPRRHRPGPVQIKFSKRGGCELRVIGGKSQAKDEDRERPNKCS